jgi:hypothetical protein
MRAWAASEEWADRWAESEVWVGGWVGGGMGGWRERARGEYRFMKLMK